MKGVIISIWTHPSGSVFKSIPHMQDSGKVINKSSSIIGKYLLNKKYFLGDKCSVIVVFAHCKYAFRWIQLFLIMY